MSFWSKNPEGSDTDKHLEIRLKNIRKWLAVGMTAMLITDFLILWPDFKEKPLFPNKIGMILQGVVTYPMWVGLIYSYKKDNLKPIYWMLILYIVRAQLGFFNLPGPEVGAN